MNLTDLLLFLTLFAGIITTAIFSFAGIETIGGNISKIQSLICIFMLFREIGLFFVFKILGNTWFNIILAAIVNFPSLLSNGGKWTISQTNWRRE